MPLIKPRTSRMHVVRQMCRVQEPNRDALAHHARFVGDTYATTSEAFLGLRTYGGPSTTA